MVVVCVVCGGGGVRGWGVVTQHVTITTNTTNKQTHHSSVPVQQVVERLPVALVGVLGRRAQAAGVLVRREHKHDAQRRRPRDDEVEHKEEGARRAALVCFSGGW